MTQQQVNLVFLKKMAIKLFALDKKEIKPEDIDLFYQPVNSNLAPTQGYIVWNEEQFMKIHAISTREWEAKNKFDGTPTVNFAVLTEVEWEKLAIAL